MAAVAGAWDTSCSVSGLVQQANSRRIPSGSKKYTERMYTPSYISLETVHSLSSWLEISLTSTPLSMSRWRYSSNFSLGTLNATWFIEPWAVVRSPTPGRAAADDTPGTASGALGNQKKATQSPPP